MTWLIKRLVCLLSLCLLVSCFSNERVIATPENIGVNSSTSELALNDLLNGGVDDTNDAIDFSNIPRSVNNTGDAFDL